MVLEADAELPAWATSACPEGEWIAFNAGPDFAPVDAPVDIWKVRTDGSGLTNLTDDPDANDAFPAWSSDCERIVFRSGRDGNKEIHVMDADGSNRRRLTDHPATDTAPHLSPDGEHVVFSTNRGGAGFRLWLQAIDGGEGGFLEPELSDVPGRDMHPRFSPDGKWIVFVSSRGGINDEWVYTRAPQPYGEVWAIPASGGEAVRLTRDKWENGLPRWGRGEGSEALQNAETTAETGEVAPDTARKPRGSFACTEVVGFSQTLEWYGSFSIDELGIERARSTVLEPGHFLPRWQARIVPGASVDQWRDPEFSGWEAPLRSETVCQREAIDRVVLNVSGSA
ncbi:MAG: PD40 domain-containing protein [Phycisphaerae bacterium]|nr:PD40 domain-containing protein [Phycisphaerae bacterium]